jgi:deoxyribonuclease-4
MFGSHLSISGGLHNALLAAESFGMQTVQVFTKNQQQWQAKPLDPAAVSSFKSHADRLGFRHIVAHDSYLINLAAQDPVLWEKSIAAFADEMRRCDQLGIAYLVTHPGAHVGSGEDAGIARVIAAFRRILQDTPGTVTVCLENTAGQGSSLGYRLEHLAAMLTELDAAGFAHRLAVCLDTAHLLAAGYDLTTAAGTTAVLSQIDRLLPGGGVARVKAWHLNDSKKPLASRVDRHEHIGRGCIGLDAFRVICADPRFAATPKILETPKETAPNGQDWDAINLQILLRLAAGKKVSLRLPAPPHPPKTAKKPAH